MTDPNSPMRAEKDGIGATYLSGSGEFLAIITRSKRVDARLQRSPL